MSAEETVKEVERESRRGRGTQMNVSSPQHMSPGKAKAEKRKLKAQAPDGTEITFNVIDY